MQRLIDANALDEKLESLKNRYAARGRTQVADDYNFVQMVLSTAPTIDAVPVVRSKWKLHKDGSGTCQNCKRRQDAVWDMDNWQKFCGHCGAKMDLEVDE